VMPFHAGPLWLWSEVHPCVVPGYCLLQECGFLQLRPVQVFGRHSDTLCLLVELHPRIHQAHTVMNSKCSWTVVSTPTVIPLLDEMPRCNLPVSQNQLSAQKILMLCAAVGWTWDRISSPYCVLKVWRPCFTFCFIRNVMIQHCCTLGVTRSVAILYHLVRARKWVAWPHARQWVQLRKMDLGNVSGQGSELI
jgi:hypothetical protein